MGHRALVAYERPDELYNLHYSHNGGLHLRLKRELTSRTPFGGKETNSRQELLTELLESTDSTDSIVEAFLGADDRPQTAVDVKPKTTRLTKDEILTEYLNYADTEAFYVVSSEFDVTAYRVHWFGLYNVADTAEASPLYGYGALRTVRWYDGESVGDGFVQGEFKTLKRITGDLLDRGVFTHEEAVEYLKQKLIAWTDERTELIIRTSSVSH
ncbi:DUF6735 family protein [Halorussus aquaticus]|uniref:DUF6735 family protein n=1 Tax=Halorussus aquaticus TaxID=2953748 RepID=A0ABD5Q5Q0_9EURY